MLQRMYGLWALSSPLLCNSWNMKKLVVVCLKVHLHIVAESYKIILRYYKHISEMNKVSKQPAFCLATE